MNKLELKTWAESTIAKTYWEQDVADFVLKWFDDNDYIEVKTSGSTGLPKTIRHLKKAMRHSARLTCKFLKLKPGMNALLCLNTHSIAGMMMVVRAIECQLNLLLVPPKGNPLNDISEQITIHFAAMVPAQVYNCIYSEEQKPKLNSIQNLIIGGAPVSYELQKQISMLQGNIFITFGMTETLSHIAMRRLNGMSKTDEFTLLKGINIETDPSGNLIVHAPHLSHYPIITNDIVTLTSPKTFIWLGRQDHVINYGGHKLLPEIIEEKLAFLMNEFFKDLGKDPHSTQRYFIHGEPNEKLGSIPVLVVECPSLSNLQKERLKEQIELLLPREESPRTIYTIEKFIETPTNKIIRQATFNRIITT